VDQQRLLCQLQQPTQAVAVALLTVVVKQSMRSEQQLQEWVQSSLLTC
jgi:hypothetical protein